MLGVSQRHNLSHRSVSCVSFLGCYFCWFSMDSSFNTCICCQNEKRRDSHTQIRMSPHTRSSPHNQSSLCFHTGSQSFCSHMGSHIGTGPSSSHMGSQIDSHSGPRARRGWHSQRMSSFHHRRDRCRKSSLFGAGKPGTHTQKRGELMGC